MVGIRNCFIFDGRRVQGLLIYSGLVRVFVGEGIVGGGGGVESIMVVRSGFHFQQVIYLRSGDAMVGD